MPCSQDDPCTGGLTCDQGRCVGCSPDFAGCPCDAGQCGAGLSCSEANQCEPLACADGARNGDETDLDCGGSCKPCVEGSRCLSAADCESLACDREACLAVGSCLVRTGEFPTIQSAVDDTRCTKVLLEEGLFDERVRVDRAIEIIGVPSVEALGDGTVLSSTESGPTVEITEGTGTVYLRHLQIRDGSALRGAGVLSERDLVVEDSLFTGNRASVNAVSEEEELHPCGGAIFVEDANLTVRDSIFVDNQAEETRFTGLRIDVEASGGAICVLGEGELLVESSKFSRNLATTTTDIPAGFRPPDAVRASSAAAGGAIYRHGGSILVRDSTFTDNMARASVAARESESRSAESAGGAISVTDLHQRAGPTVIERSSFVENVARADGAGIGSWLADADGGAVKIVKDAWIRDTTFEHNWAIAKHPESSLSYGGGASLGIGRLESTRFFRNRVDGTYASGGALHLRAPGTIVNSVFWDNRGLRSSGIHMQNRGWLLNSTLVDNAPGPQLQGPFSSASELVIKHSVVAGGHGSCDHRLVVSGGYNVFEEGDCLAPLATETDRVVSAALVEIGYNRSEGLRAPYSDIFSAPGFPLANSPVIDGGDPNGCRDEADNVIAVDNRGADRDGPCDIGAFAFEPEQPTRIALNAFLLRRVTLRAPEFFAPSEGGCVSNVTQELAAFINESITGDNARPPDQECDGLIGAPLVLILESRHDGTGFSLLKPTQCVATHVACEDPWPPSGHWPGRGEFRILAEELCTLGAGSAVVAPGANGCIEAELGSIDFDVGFRFVFSHAELIGELDVLPERITNGVLRAFIGFGTGIPSAFGPAIPSSMQAALGGATVLSDLLCAAELEERDGELGYVVEFGVEFEAVTLYGQGLPPIRPVDCE